jgi:hypothetical protein
VNSFYSHPIVSIFFFLGTREHILGLYFTIKLKMIMLSIPISLDKPNGVSFFMLKEFLRYYEAMRHEIMI